MENNKHLVTCGDCGKVNTADNNAEEIKCRFCESSLGEEKIIESPPKEKYFGITKNDVKSDIKSTLTRISVGIVVLSILKIYRSSQGIEQCFLCIFPLW